MAPDEDDVCEQHQRPLQILVINIRLECYLAIESILSSGGSKQNEREKNMFRELLNPQIAYGKSSTLCIRVPTRIHENVGRTHVLMKKILFDY